MVGNLADLAEGNMRALILGGSLRPGERIYEAATAKRMGFSRAPLREALRRLEAQGVVVAMQGEGVFVRSYSQQDVAHVADMRLCLESFAVARIVAMPDRELPNLPDRLEALERTYAAAFAQPHPGAVIEANLTFHVSLVRLASNPRLSACFEALAAELRLIHSLSMVEDDPLFLNSRTYTPLIGRITARDRAGAEAEIDRLIRGFASKTLDSASHAPSRKGATSSPRRKASSEHS